MKKIIIIVVLVVLLLIIVVAIMFKNNKVKISDEEILSSNNIYLEYRVSSMREAKKYIFSIKNDIQKFDIYSYNDELLSSNELSSDDVDIFKSALIEGNVNKWDGFGKSNKYVLDGVMFNFKLIINDIEINAYGSNSFPKGYNEFNKKIHEIINKYGIIE